MKRQFIKDTVLAPTGLSYKDYLTWCHIHHKPEFNSKTKAEFFDAYLNKTLEKKSNGLFENGVPLDEWDEELLK